MKFLTFAKTLLILILPVLLFLLIANFTGFNLSFYKEKFLQYDVEKNVPEAGLLHEKVIDFITGNSNQAPSNFDEKEKQHLWDVRNTIKYGKILLYFLVVLFIVLLLLSAFIIKANNIITNFVGKIFLYGGILTIVIAAFLFLLINFGFSSTFEAFHQAFFRPGTYVFDAKEKIVNIYPEQLFMDLGLRISKWVVVSALIIILIGLFLVVRSKKNK